MVRYADEATTVFVDTSLHTWLLFRLANRVLEMAEKIEIYRTVYYQWDGKKLNAVKTIENNS